MPRPRGSRRRPPARRTGFEVFRLASPRLIPPPNNGFSVTILGPVNGFASRDRTPDVTVVGTSVLASPVDIQVEWRQQRAIQAGTSPTPSTPWTPAPVYTTEVAAAISGTPQSIEPPTDLPFGTWWYRARAGSIETGLWSDWSIQYYLDVYPVLGSTVEYLEVNIGVEPLQALNAHAYFDLNIGVGNEQELAAFLAYFDLNIGAEVRSKLAAEYTHVNIYTPTGTYRASAYTDLNALTDLTPTPHIWWIRPEQGREGYVFNIYGHGFGDFQNQHNGTVMLGNIACAIARWERVPAELLSSTVRVTGTPRATTSTTALPTVIVNDVATRLVAAGDIIEYDMLWEVPSATRLDIFPTFTVSGVSEKMGYGANLLNDTTGDPWISDQPEAYGQWHHRRFVVPLGSSLIGKTLSNFGIAWYGFDGAQPVRTASIRSFVIRSADETPVIWVTGDDEQNNPALTYIANTGTLTASEFDREGHIIEHGQALDPDIITPEHGWIVAIVPSGAMSASVRVTLEE